MTIGEFARASGLTPKALRLYDGMGLLGPARVDPFTGYRFYAPGQLPCARLIVRLRRLGMPLARIRTVCDRPGELARSVREFWAEAEAEHAARRELADQLAGAWPESAATAGPALVLCGAAVSDPGRVRAANQDTAFAGQRLLAVADGFGPAGAPAGTAAVAALRPLDRGTATAPEAVRAAVRQAGAAVRAVTGTGAPGGSGTTLTALVWTGSRVAVTHVGDSRAYVLRAGRLHRLTRDHTWVQAQVERGLLTPEEAAAHPQRALLLRALGDAPVNGPVDTAWWAGRPGDRYVVCSDGLSATVPDDALRAALADAPDAPSAADRLLTLAHATGAPDNVSCAVGDLRAA